MESPTSGMAPVPVECGEDMNRYIALPPAMFEVPHVNGQNNFHSGSYPDWGANNSYNETRRRAMRNKPLHGRRSPQQQPSWSPEYAPATAPVSPPWQPQAAPAPETSGFQESSGPIAVNLQGLPPALCRKNFLEAMLDQAGLADDIMGCVLGEEQDAGKAVIYLGNYNSAMKCVQHFGGRRWANAGQLVTAQIAEGQGPPAASAPAPAPVAPRAPTNSRTAGARKQRNSNNGQEQVMLSPVALPIAPGGWGMQQPMLPPSAFQQCPAETTGRNSPTSTGSNGSNSPKTNRWADIEDDDKDGSEGFEGSTSAGSTGRQRQEAGESFFFGCDVDTDDGF